MTKQIRPGSKVKIISGKMKGQEKTVSIIRSDKVFLKNALKKAMDQKSYEVNVDISNCKILK